MKENLMTICKKMDDVIHLFAQVRFWGLYMAILQLLLKSGENSNRWMCNIPYIKYTNIPLSTFFIIGHLIFLKVAYLAKNRNQNIKQQKKSYTYTLIGTNILNIILAILMW